MFVMRDLLKASSRRSRRALQQPCHACISDSPPGANCKSHPGVTNSNGAAQLTAVLELNVPLVYIAEDKSNLATPALFRGEPQLQSLAVGAS